MFSLLGQRCSNRLPPHHLADLEVLALAVDLEALALAVVLAVVLAVLALAVVPVLILVLDLVSFCPR